MIPLALSFVNVNVGYRPIFRKRACRRSVRKDSTPASFFQDSSNKSKSNTLPNSLETSCATESITADFAMFNRFVITASRSFINKSSPAVSDCKPAHFTARQDGNDEAGGSECHML